MGVREATLKSLRCAHLGNKARMKHLNLLAVVLFSVNAPAFAAPPETFIDIACPEEWELSGNVVPVVPVVPTDSDPWQDENDKNKARAHVGSADLVDTLDALPPVGKDDRVNDLLTVASECLVFKNLLVDGEQYYPQPGSVTRAKSNGWIPAAF